MTSKMEKRYQIILVFTGDINSTAYLNWWFDSSRSISTQMSEMGRVYYETALYLLNECIEDNIDNKADGWIFQILFHVVHGVEVYFKSFNSQTVNYLTLHKTDTSSQTP